jgi:ferredoxin-like protein FixX
MFSLVAMRALGERLVYERVMCPAFASPALRMSSLGICHIRIISFVGLGVLVGPSSQVEQVVQYLPSRVHVVSNTTAARDVTIEPAVGTQAFAIRCAEWLHRNGENDLLPGYVRQIDPVISIEAHQKLVLIQTSVVLSCPSDVVGLRQEKKVQILANRCFEPSEAPITSKLEIIRYHAPQQPKRSSVTIIGKIRPRDMTDHTNGPP